MAPRQDDDEDKPVDIVVTAPSSPDVPAHTNGIEHEHEDQHIEPTFLPLDRLTVPLPLMSTQPTPPPTRFEDALALANLPEPGPAYFDARREVWRTFRGTQPVQTTQPSARMKKLQAMLHGGDTLESDKCWNAGLDKFWKGLMTGQRIRERLPLRDLVKVLQAGWVRDGTWPKGQVAPEPDDELRVEETPLASTTTDASCLATPNTPGTLAEESLHGRFTRFLGIGGPSR